MEHVAEVIVEGTRCFLPAGRLLESAHLAVGSELYLLVGLLKIGISPSFRVELDLLRVAGILRGGSFVLQFHRETVAIRDSLARLLLLGCLSYFFLL